jgi:hypothetical protein
VDRYVSPLEHIILILSQPVFALPTSHAQIFSLDCIICCLSGLSSDTCDLIESNNKNSLWEVILSQPVFALPPECSMLSGEAANTNFT